MGALMLGVQISSSVAETSSIEVRDALEELTQCKPSSIVLVKTTLCVRRAKCIFGNFKPFQLTIYLQLDDIITVETSLSTQGCNFEYASSPIGCASMLCALNARGSFESEMIGRGGGEPGWIRTIDHSIKSRMLYH